MFSLPARHWLSLLCVTVATTVSVSRVMADDDGDAEGYSLVPGAELHWPDRTKAALAFLVIFFAFGALSFFSLLLSSCCPRVFSRCLPHAGRTAAQEQAKPTWRSSTTTKTRVLHFLIWLTGFAALLTCLALDRWASASPDSVTGDDLTVYYGTSGGRVTKDGETERETYGCSDDDDANPDNFQSCVGMAVGAVISFCYVLIALIGMLVSGGFFVYAERTNMPTNRIYVTMGASFICTLTAILTFPLTTFLVLDAVLDMLHQARPMLNASWGLLFPAAACQIILMVYYWKNIEAHPPAGTELVSTGAPTTESGKVASGAEGNVEMTSHNDAEASTSPEVDENGPDVVVFHADNEAN